MPRRTCPHCRESMHVEATTCPHCRERSTPPAEAPAVPPPRKPAGRFKEADLIAMVGLGVFIIVIVVMVVSGTKGAWKPDGTASPSMHPDDRTERVLSYTRDQLRQQCREQRRGVALERCLQEADAVTKP